MKFIFDRINHYNDNYFLLFNNILEINYQKGENNYYHFYVVYINDYGEIMTELYTIEEIKL